MRIQKCVLKLEEMKLYPLKLGNWKIGIFFEGIRKARVLAAPVFAELTKLLSSNRRRIAFGCISVILVNRIISWITLIAWVPPKVPLNFDHRCYRKP